MMKFLSQMLLLAMLATVTSGCATAMWHDKITSRQFVDSSWQKTSVKGAYLGVTSRGTRSYHEYIFPDPIWKNGTALHLLLPVDDTRKEVIIGRVHAEDLKGQRATINYFPPHWTSDRRNNNYSYLKTNAAPASKTTFIKRTLLCSSYPASIDFRIGESFNSACVQAGWDFGVTNNPDLVLNTQSEFFVSEDEWTARNWSSTGNWFWCQWAEPVTINGGLDPRKWKERLLSLGYVVTVPIDTITMPVMWPFYVFTYKMNRGMSPR